MMAAASDSSVKIAVTGDVHGHFFDTDPLTLTPARGSLARVSRFVDTLRASLGADRVILADNGDLFTGTPSAFFYNYMDSTLPHRLAAEVDAMGYDILNAGNHDLEMATCAAGRIRSSLHVPRLGGNSGGRATAVIDRGGVRIGFIGLSTAETPRLFNGVTLSPMRPAALAEALRRDEGVDYVVGLLHAGLAETAAAVAGSGLDAVVYGHDHLPRVTLLDGGRIIAVNPGARAESIALLTIGPGGIRGETVPMTGIPPTSAPEVDFSWTPPRGLTMATLVERVLSRLYPGETQLLPPLVPGDFTVTSAAQIFSAFPYDDHPCLAFDPISGRSFATDTYTAHCRNLTIVHLSPLPLKSYLF